MKKIVSIILTLVLLTTAITALAEGTLQSKINPDDEYVAVCAYNNIEYFNAAKYAWEQAGILFGVKTSWVGPMDGDINAVVTAFDSAVAKRPAGITVWGFDPSLQYSIDSAIEQGIPVVTFCGDVAGSQRLTYVGSLQFDLGFEGGKLYAESVGGVGKVAILTLPGNPQFEERQRGFEEAFALYPGIDVVGYGDTKADTVVAIGAAKDLINRNPDLTGFVCTDSTGAIGASTALQELDKVGVIDILGMDRNSDILQMIKEGTITASIVQNDVSMTYWAMLALITANYVDMGLTSDNAAANAVASPLTIYTSVNLATAENADYYLEANELYASNPF